MNNKPKEGVTIEEFHEKNKMNRISYLKIIILLLGIVNIIIVIFSFILLSNTSAIRDSNIAINNDIEIKEKEYLNNNKMINKKLVALYSSYRIFYYKYLQLIKTEDEYNRIMEWLGTKYQDVYLCFSNTGTSGYGYDPFYYCQFNTVLVFIYRTYKGHRFGFVLFNFDYYLTGVIKDEKAFLFNFDNKKIFEVNNSSNAYSFNKDENKLVIGNEDLVIDFTFQNQRCYSKFPNNYGKPGDTLFDLIGEEAVNEHLSLHGLEIVAKYNLLV